ncbi:MAG: helix-turn-helix domain-containing protein [Longimicrobiales bacterium]
MQAIHLMQSSSTLSVKEIAAAVGYNYVTSFDRNFKKMQGMTPTEWRRLASP